MERKTKLAIFTVAIVAALSWSLLAVVPFATADEQELEVPAFDGQRVTLELNRDGLAYRIRRRDAILRRFITDGALVTLEGEIVGISQHLLVIRVNEQILNILMPGRWVVNGDIITYPDLTSTQLMVGQAVTIDTLKLSLEKDTHTITAYLAYAFEADGLAATALLPFNVEVYAIN